MPPQSRCACCGDRHASLHVLRPPRPAQLCHLMILLRPVPSLVLLHLLVPHYALALDQVPSSSGTGMRVQWVLASLLTLLPLCAHPALSFVVLSALQPPSPSLPGRDGARFGIHLPRCALSAPRTTRADLALQLSCKREGPAAILHPKCGVVVDQRVKLHPGRCYPCRNPGLLVLSASGSPRQGAADGDEDATAEVFYEKVSQLLKATGGDVDTATLARRWKKVSLCLSLSACVCGRPPPNISIMIADTALRVRHVVLDACNF